MGNLIAKIQSPLEAAAGSVTQIISGSKRKRSDDNDGSSNETMSMLERSMNTPKKKKLLTTAQYIYKTLFQEENNSDITVVAFDKTWHLHKVYLCQSPYFASMFGGAWRETRQSVVKIDIIDPKITFDALYIVFGSLYLDEVELEASSVVSVLAAASLFQLDGLIERCAEVMVESTNAKTAIVYYESACQYGVPNVKTVTFNWLLINLLDAISKNAEWLRSMNGDLMASLITSPELFVMQTEFSIYIMLRFWMILKLHPNFNGTTSSTYDPTTYFTNRDDRAIPFLQTVRGREFERPFRALRLQHLISHHGDMKVLTSDNIIPINWLQQPLYNQWQSVLRIDETLDRGPKEIDDRVFYANCVRCGRKLMEEGFTKWRWTGFNFGIDLVLATGTKMLSIRRHHRSENERMLSLLMKRNVMVRVTVVSQNEMRQVQHKQTTGIKLLCLEKNQEIPLMRMDNELTHPLLVSVNILTVTPESDCTIPLPPNTVAEESDPVVVNAADSIAIPPQIDPTQLLAPPTANNNLRLPDNEAIEPSVATLDF